MEHVVLLKLKMSGRSWTRRNGDLTSQTARMADAQDDAVSVVERVLDMKHSLLKPVGEFRSSAKRFFKATTLPWRLDTATGLVPASRYGEVRDRLKGISDSLDEYLRETLQGAWPVVVAHMKDIRGSLFREDDYPEAEAIPGIWGMQLLTLPLPDMSTLHGIFGTQQESAMAETEAAIDETISLAKRALFERVYEALDTFRDRVARVQSGEQKTIRDGTVEALNETIAIVNSLNAWPGELPALEALVSDVQKLGSISPDALRGPDMAPVRRAVLDQTMDLSARLKASMEVF